MKDKKSLVIAVFVFGIIFCKDMYSQFSEFEKEVERLYKRCNRKDIHVCKICGGCIKGITRKKMKRSVALGSLEKLLCLNSKNIIDNMLLTKVFLLFVQEGNTQVCTHLIQTYGVNPKKLTLSKNEKVSPFEYTQTIKMAQLLKQKGAKITFLILQKSVAYNVSCQLFEFYISQCKLKNSQKKKLLKTLQQSISMYDSQQKMECYLKKFKLISKPSKAKT